VARAGVNVRTIDQGSGEFNIILSISEKDMTPVIKAIYEEFFGKESV